MTNARWYDELPAGTVNYAVDQPPSLIHAHVRPYVVALLLHRGALRVHEIIAAICPQCQIDDLKAGVLDPLDNVYYEGTRLEKVLNEVLLEFETGGFIRYNEKKEIWVLTNQNLSTILSWVTLLNAQIPVHFLHDHYGLKEKTKS